MGRVVINVGSFDLTSHNGNTAYSTTRYFNIPANNVITKCVATFVTHVNTGSFQGKSFSLNSVQAHPNTPWPTSGIELNPALLSAGSNAFRAAVKSQAGLSARWSIGDIYLTIDYTDPSSGEGSQPNGVSVSVTPSILVIGEAGIAISTANPADRWHTVDWVFADQSGSYTVGWGQAYSATITPPMSWCDKMPNSNSGIFTVTVTEYDTPAPPHHISNIIVKEIVMQVPSSAVPSIGDFTAALNSNGVDASITKYVQNYSKADLEIVGAVGALGSTIATYEITGGGWIANADIATFGPFPQAGDITFIAKVTDTRGRTATKSVTISIMPYTPVSGSGLSAFRSDVSGDPADEGTYAAMKGKRVFGSLDSQNTAVIKGRVFEKGTTPPDWTNMSDDTLLLIGSLSIEKGYTAQIAIADKITSVIYIIEIPTAIVGMHILPGATGASFGMYAKEGWFSVPWPVDSSEGACPGIGDILYTLNPTHPAIRFPGTTWAAHEGVFLLGADETYEAGDTGGSATLQLGLGSGYAKIGVLTSNYVHLKTKAVPTGDAYETYISGTTYSPATNAGGRGTELGGTTDSGSILPPFLSVYIWERTA